MDRKTNKLPALLFALVMTFSLLSVRAFAAGTSTALITSVSVTIEAPVAGLNPDYDPVLPSDAGCYNDGNVNTGNWRNHVVWKDLSDETSGDNSLDPNHGIFKLGHRYHVIIYLTPRDGYSFSESAAATLNGNAAQTSAASGSRLIVEYTFPALETSWVSSARVTLDAPEAGTRPDYTAAFPSGAQYYSEAHDSTYNLNDILWRDTTEGKYVSTADSMFQAGHEYEVIVYLTPKDGYAFSSGTAATINGKAAPASMSSGLLQVKYYFPALPETISSVSVFISSPVAGLSPDYEPLFPSNANYYNENVDTGNYRNYIVWKDLSNETSADNSLDPDSDVFKLGHRYQVIIYLTPRDGYSFSNNVTAKFPPKTAQVTPASNGRIIVEYTFPEVNTSWIPSAYITLDAPVPDARPDYTAVFPSGAQYYSFANNTGNYCNDIIWRDSTDGEDMDKENSVFRAGHEYEVTVYLTANSAYAFASGTAARINGKTAQAKTSYGQLEVKYTFAPLPDLVSSVSVTFDAPVAGLHPDYEPEFPSGAHYYNENVNTGNYRNYIVWKDLSDETSADNSLNPNEPDPDVFKFGHRYRVIIYLTPKDGFTFAESVTARVNGSAVQATPANKGRIIVEYTFPEVNTSWIPSAVITLDAPEAGASPDYTAVFPSGAHYYSEDTVTSFLRNDIGWRDVTDGNKPMYLADSGSFQAGHEYEVTVYLTPRDGYAFSSGTTATINGKTARAETSYDELLVRYTFAALPENISSVSVTVDEPVARLRPDYEPVFPSGANYYNDNNVDTGGYLNHIVWIDLDGTSADNSIDPENGVFELNHRYQVIMYLTPENGYAFSNSVTAKLNGKTAQAELGSNGRLIVTYTFPALETSWIPYAAITLDAPEADALPDYFAVFPSDAHYFSADQKDSNFRNDICWKDSTDGTILNPYTGRFQAGHEYEVTVYLTAQDAHVFSSETTATINGKTAQASLVSGKLEVKYTFSALPKTISSVSFTAGSPVAGQHPSYDLVFPADANYYNDNNVDTGSYRNHVEWKEITNDSAEGSSLDPDKGVFQLAYRYQVIVYLTPQDGYVFSRNVTAKVNGKTAQTTAGDKGRLIVTYTFASTEKPVLVATWKNSDGTVLETDWVLYGATPSYKGDLPQKESTAQYSYVFDGWTPAVTYITESVTYTATYTAYLRSYTVTFNADGGSPEPSAQTVKYGSSASEPAPPAKTGYDFAGWYNGSKKYDFSTAVTGAVTLKAKWTVKACSVSFGSNGGSGTMAPEKVDYGKSFSLPSCGFTAPEGKQFDRWDIGGTKYDPEDLITVTSNLTAKATWKDLPPASYTITVSSSVGGKATVSVSSATEGTTVAVKVTPSQGYALSKLTWTAEGGTAKDITSAKKFTMPAKNVTIRAVFKSVVPSVSGSVSGSTLSYATANVPSGAVLIAARYDGGRQTYAAVIAGPVASGSVAMKGKGTAYRLYLAESGTYKPLCEAWSS